MLNIKAFVVNPFSENTFVVYDEQKNCIIIDPGCLTKSENDDLLRFLRENDLQPSKILYTHCHLDHIVGAPNIAKNFPNVEIYTHRDEEVSDEEISVFAAHYGMELSIVMPRITGYLNDGDKLAFGSQTIDVMCVRGHSPAGLCYYFGSENVLFCGDVLFKGSIGRTDMAGGDYESLIGTIKSKLLNLPDDCECLCGHGPYTTIGLERQTNPFLL